MQCNRGQPVFALLFRDSKNIKRLLATLKSKILKGSKIFDGGSFCFVDVRQVSSAQGSAIGQFIIFFVKCSLSIKSSKFHYYFMTLLVPFLRQCLLCILKISETKLSIPFFEEKLVKVGHFKNGAFVKALEFQKLVHLGYPMCKTQHDKNLESDSSTQRRCCYSVLL